MNVNLSDAVMYLRELLVMNKKQLHAEVRHHPDLCGKVKNNDIIAYAFEHKFDPKTTPPTNKTGRKFNIRYGGVQ